MANVKKKHQEIIAASAVSNVSVGENKLAGLLPNSWLVFLIGFIAIAYYANSIGGTYVLDDAIVISENQFTQQGVAGWPGIFGNDTFFGFFKESGKDHLVAGGRYRPLSLAMFALEGQIFDFKPIIFHIFNLLYFALTCMLLFVLLRKILSHKLEHNSAQLIAFFAALIFTVHPIHTEVVANIKGRDELLCCLFGLAGTYFLWKGAMVNKLLPTLVAALFMFLSMLSKENGIVFIALAPLAIWFFSDKSAGRIVISSIPLIAIAAVYLLIRHSVLGSPPNNGPIVELMNNPFLAWTGNGYLPIDLSQKLATISVTMVRYLWLSIIPYPLTSDYYPKQIAITTWSDFMAILGVLIYGAMIVWSIIRLRKKEIAVFGLLFYLIALFPMSNVLFPVGTLMSERFLFIPSIGISLIIAWLLCKYVVKNKPTSKLNIGLIAIILILGLKTIARNTAWKDNFTLFTTDVLVSTNSAKMQNSAGGILVDSASRAEDAVIKSQLLDEAQAHLLKAIELHPSYSNAYLLLGNAFAYKNDFVNAAGNYELALKYNSGFKDANNNLAIAYREIGKAAGEKEGNLAKALEYLRKSLTLNPKDPETNRLTGVAIGMSGAPNDALAYFIAAHEADKENAFYMFDLGSAYANIGNAEKAKFYHEEAIRKDPTLQKRLIK